NPAHLARLINELDSPEFRRRQKATEELQYLGTRAVPALRKAIGAGAALEPRRRMELLLRKIETESATELHKVKTDLAATRSRLAKRDAEAERQALQAKLVKMKEELATAKAALAKLKGDEKRSAEVKLLESELEILLIELKTQDLSSTEAL